MDWTISRIRYDAENKGGAMVRRSGMLAAAACIMLTASAQAIEQQSPSDRALAEKYNTIIRSLHPMSGNVPVPAANAVLHLGRNYYYLGAAEAKKVLVEAWGNPPRSVDGVLGMVFPVGKTFLDDSWGAVVTYDQTGYVTDNDAKSADYNKIVADAHSIEDERNEERQKQGFSTEHLVGWAQPPSYDPATHSVIWARDIRFGNERDDTLNYDVRLLGRRGVLSLNMVSAMSKLPEIRSAAVAFGQAASFEAGARYGDYQPGSDKKAGYGIAGLVAAGVGVAAAKKFGLLALLAVFGKKLVILAAALFAGMANWFKRRLRRSEP